MSDQIALPQDFEFFSRVRPFTPGEIATLKPLCEKYAAWKERHNGGRPPLDADAARELATIYDALKEWGMQQMPPFILAPGIERRLPEQRRREVVAEMLHNAGLSDEKCAALAPQRTDGCEEEPETPRMLPAILSASELAKHLGKNRAAVESFLRRYRGKYPDCSVDTEARRKNTAKYLYRVAEVLPALEQHFGVN